MAVSTGSHTGSSGLIIATHEVCELHNPGAGHPESAQRLVAVRRGLEAAKLGEALRWVEAPLVDRTKIDRVHNPYLYDRLQELASAGGGAIDADTTVSSESAEAASRAAGAGLDLIDRLRAGEADVGWSVVRPPGHHATAERQMGFCLFNNIAVAAQSLADEGERVVIVDVDAHHGNGTQDIFYQNPDVLFVSFHQFPWYPYTGRPDETGDGEGSGSTVNIAVPASTGGVTYRAAFDTVVLPIIEAFAPTWVLVSAGFDGHRADPLTNLGLTSADYADLVSQIVEIVPPGHRLVFLEGGYDLQALADSAGAVAAALVGEEFRPEAASERAHVDDTQAAEYVDLARRAHLDQLS